MLQDDWFIADDSPLHFVKDFGPSISMNTRFTEQKPPKQKKSSVKKALRSLKATVFKPFPPLLLLKINRVKFLPLPREDDLDFLLKHVYLEPENGDAQNHNRRKTSLNKRFLSATKRKKLKTAANCVWECLLEWFFPMYVIGRDLENFASNPSSYDSDEHQNTLRNDYSGEKTFGDVYLNRDIVQKDTISNGKDNHENDEVIEQSYVDDENKKVDSKLQNVHADYCIYNRNSMNTERKALPYRIDETPGTCFHDNVKNPSYNKCSYSKPTFSQRNTAGDRSHNGRKESEESNDYIIDRITVERSQNTIETMQTFITTKQDLFKCLSQRSEHDYIRFVTNRVKIASNRVEMSSERVSYSSEASSYTGARKNEKEQLGFDGRKGTSWRNCVGVEEEIFHARELDCFKNEQILKEVTKFVRNEERDLKFDNQGFSKE